MASSKDFLNSFDDQGRYLAGNGELDVVFLSPGGISYPGKLRFANGLLMNANMGDSGPWGYPDGSPLNGLKFVLSFPGEQPREVFVSSGHVHHHFEYQDAAAREQFLTNLRIARNLLDHSREVSDQTLLDPTSTFESSTRGALWLTPRTMKNFHAPSFSELDADQQLDLWNAVQAFQDVARQVPIDQLPTKEQYRLARSTLHEILNILGPYLTGLEPDESRRVGKALGTVSFPPWVVNWDFELGNSEDGDPAVWIYVFAEGPAPLTNYGHFGVRIIPTIREALAAEGVRRWPYLRLRTVAEYKTA